MTAGLKPYPRVRDTGVPTLGEVPEHWNVQKLRSLLLPVTERNRPDLPLLSVVREKGIILRDLSGKDKNHNFVPDDLTNYKVVLKGQFAMNKMKAWQGSYGVSKYNGIVSPAYFVFDLSDIDGGYFHTAIRSRAYIPSFTQASDGVRIGQWDLSQPRMREIAFVVPTGLEQAAIARFLDHATSRIDRYIRAKEKLIALLDEYKQALIHQAVTGQIDVRTDEPYSEYTESGVEWIREIPLHWNEISLQFVSKLIQIGPFGSQLHASDYVDGGTPVINPAHMRGGQIQPDSSISINAQKVAELAKHRLETFDVVMARRGELGRCALVEHGESGWICGTGSLRIKPNLKIVIPEFLVLVLGSKGTRETLSLSSVGATMNNLNTEIVSRLRIPLPPLAEQRNIVNFVDAVQSEIDKCMRHMQNQIYLLGEYRTRTIADVVTGKLDVRKAAAELPDTNAVAWEDGVDTIQAESNSHRAEHSIAEEANA